MLHRRREGGLSAVEVLGCRNLYRAVLEDAIEMLKYPVQHLSFQTRSKRRLADYPETPDDLVMARVENDRRWVLSDKDSEPFAFVRCCEEMNLEPSAVRASLRKQGLLDAPAQLVEAGLKRPRKFRHGGGRSRNKVAAVG